MTIQEVADCIAKIDAVKWDDESAHSREDAMRETVLRAIADGTAEDAAEMARLALTTEDMDFARWCA